MTHIILAIGGVTYLWANLEFFQRIELELDPQFLLLFCTKWIAPRVGEFQSWEEHFQIWALFANNLFLLGLFWKPKHLVQWKFTFLSKYKLSGSSKARTLAKNQLTQRKPLFFVNSTSGSLSKNAKIWFSKWIFYHPFFSFLKKLRIINSLLRSTFFCKRYLLITSIF